MWTVVYDIRTAGLSIGSWVPIVLVLIGFGILMRLFRDKLMAIGAFRRMRSFPTLFLGIAVLWAVGLYASAYASRTHLRRRVEEGRFQTVEGVVSDYRSGGERGRSWETFTVNDLHFGYGETHQREGFGQTREMGGPIAPGRRVRVGFVSEDINLIVRLEVDRSPREQP